MIESCTASLIGHDTSLVKHEEGARGLNCGRYGPILEGGDVCAGVILSDGLVAGYLSNPLSRIVLAGSLDRCVGIVTLCHGLVGFKVLVGVSHETPAASKVSIVGRAVKQLLL